MTGKRRLLGGGLAVVTMLAWSAGGAAAPVAGFSISPAFQDVLLRADVPQAQYTVRITNRNREDQSFRLSAADFGSLDDSGGVAFLGVGSSELEHKYGLASWMKLEKDLVFVPAGKSAEVQIVVVNRPSLGPGGHYGAVLATAVADGSKPLGDAAVGVKQVLSSLVLLTKEGGEEQSLKLVSQVSNAQPWRLPTTVEQRFQNAGNVHLVPRGVVEVKDPWGRVVARAAMNEVSGVILPESFRRYKTDMMRIAPGWLPGRYSLISTYRFDGREATEAVTTYFWYAGLAVVWVVGIMALAVTAGLVWWLWFRPRKKHR